MLESLKGFKVTSASDVLNKLQSYRKTYNEKGKFLGFPSVHNHYSMQLGNCTDWTGYPISGKTQFLMEMLMNTSVMYGWRHLIYFPDVGSNVEIIADLIHKKTGKSFDPNSNNYISEGEIFSTLDWVTHHFLVLTKHDVKAKMTPMDFWDMAVKIKNDDGLHTASIDSWKDLNHPYNEYGGYAQYLEFVLPYRNAIAENNELHLHTIIHPKLTEKENGKRKPPVPYDLKGGSEWFNSGKCMITIDRPDFETNEVDIYFNKIKPRSIGNIGQITMRYDVEAGRYYESNDIHGIEHRHYAGEQKEQITTTNIYGGNSWNGKTDDDYFQPLNDVPF
jgi:hypothetical protein